MASHQVEPSYMRKIAADDFYMQICKGYSDSESPFGLVDTDALVDALRDAFAREVTGSELGRVPQPTLLPVIRHFVGPSCAYERELCDILGRMYRAIDGTTVNASALMEDFASILGPEPATLSCRRPRRPLQSRAPPRHHHVGHRGSGRGPLRLAHQRPACGALAAGASAAQPVPRAYARHLSVAALADRRLHVLDDASRADASVAPRGRDGPLRADRTVREGVA